jgi:hypothetical protein
MRKLIAPVTALAGVLAAAGAFAQDTQPQNRSMQHDGMTQTTPMQGGMCGPGGCGMGGAPGQGTPMQGQAQQGQGGMMTGGCPMMQRSAATEQRLRRLEERLGIQPPPAPPSAQPGSPG